MFSKPLSAADYQIDDGFWSEKVNLVYSKMLPYQWNVLNDRQPGAAPSHSIENFRIAAGLKEGSFQGFVFQDSDLAKWLEAVGYSLALRKDEELERQADEAIELIVKAQQPDGYLDTYYIINGLDKAWTNIADHHELYCAGHMIEAAVAYYAGTGKRRLLDAAMKLADCIDAHFGPEEGKMHGYPGHEIIEMALVRLFHVTGEEKYLRLAGYFINERGQEPNFFIEERKRNGNNDPWKNSAFRYKYYQADRPVREQDSAEGHAVRAVYLYSGMAAVAKETGDESLMAACRRLWDNVTKRQMYITGAIGSSAYGESFSFDYDLPNDTVYGETCASIGLVFWARRMLEMELHSEYADVMERALFNTCLAGMSKEGTSFFYVNPLEVLPEASEKDEGKRHVLTQRRKWFGCACCPPNLARLLSSIGRYAVTENEKRLAFHLYLGGTLCSRETGLTVRVESGLPWKGEVMVRILEGAPEDRTLSFRIPAWCCGGWKLYLNGKMCGAGARCENGKLCGTEVQAESGELYGAGLQPENGYVSLSRIWEKGDVLALRFDMPVLVQRANPRVREDIGKASVTRGPLVYCLEEADNGKGLHELSLSADAAFQEVPGLVSEGTLDLEAEGSRLLEEGWGEELYSSLLPYKQEKVLLHLVPYYLWNNRGAGEMMVWIHCGV